MAEAEAFFDAMVAEMRTKLRELSPKGFFEDMMRFIHAVGWKVRLLRDAPGCWEIRMQFRALYALAIANCFSPKCTKLR